MSEFEFSRKVKELFERFVFADGTPLRWPAFEHVSRAPMDGKGRPMEYLKARVYNPCARIWYGYDRFVIKDGAVYRSGFLAVDSVNFGELFALGVIEDDQIDIKKMPGNSTIDERLQSFHETSLLVCSVEFYHALEAVIEHHAHLLGLYKNAK